MYRNVSDKSCYICSSPTSHDIGVIIQSTENFANRGERIICRKPRPKSAYDFLGLLYIAIDIAFETLLTKTNP